MYLVEFLPGLFITDQPQNDVFYQQKKITRVINCQKELNYFKELSNYISAIQDQIKKTEHKKLHQHLIKIIDLIHNTLLDAHSIMIYDPEGTNKAALILLAYLLKYSKLSFDQITNAFESKSRIPIKLNNNFQNALKIYYQYIKQAI